MKGEPFGALWATHHAAPHFGCFHRAFIGLHPLSRPAEALGAEPENAGPGSQAALSSRSRSRPAVPGGAGGVGRRGRRTGTRRRPSAASWNRRRPCNRSRPTACRIPWLSLQHKTAVSGAGSDPSPFPSLPSPFPYLRRRAPLPPARRSAAVRFRLTPRPPRVTWELGAEDTAALLAGTCSPQRREVQGGNCGAPSRRGGGGGSVALSPQASRQAPGAHRSLPGHGSPGLPPPASAGTFPRGPLASAPPLDPDFSQLGPFWREAHTTGCPEGG